MVLKITHGPPGRIHCVHAPGGDKGVAFTIVHAPEGDREVAFTAFMRLRVTGGAGCIGVANWMRFILHSRQVEFANRLLLHAR